MVAFGFLTFLIASFYSQVYGDLIDLESQDYYQGDIILPTNRNGILADLRWPNNTIPYVISANWSDEKVGWIEETMREYEKYTCIRFVNRTTEKNYAIFISGSGCYSAVGKARAAGQYISLMDDGCWSERHLYHEIGHLIGLHHEQCSKNRDDHIYVFKDNVKPKLWYNFQIENDTDTYGVPYNPLSIMHYGTTSYTVNGLHTMYPKDGKYALNMGKTQTPHETDYEKIRRIYECEGTYPEAPQQKLYTPEPCVDKFNRCAQLAHECTTHGYALQLCRKTCEFCGLQDDVCKDKLETCEGLIDQCGKDVVTKIGCHKSCGFC